MSTSEEIEKLAAAIAEEVYLDVAKWHLFLNDAHLHIALAEKFYPAIAQGISDAQIAKILTDTPVVIGGGRRELPLIDFIPKSVQSRLYDVLEKFKDRF